MGREELLYHYTTPAGLIGIVSTNCLWATSAAHLDDSEELSGGIRRAASYLRELRDKTTGPEQSARLSWLLREIGNLDKAHLAPVFVCSFSAEPDLLSQWRAYCRGGGFAIGFPKDQLRDRAAEQRFALEKCVYSAEEHDALIKDTIERLAGTWVRQPGLPLSDDNGRFSVSSPLIGEVITASSRLKHESFAEEKESRLVSRIGRRYAAEERYFRASRGLIVPYTKIVLPDDIGFWGKVHVVVGPTPHPEESSASAYALIRRYRDHAVAVDVTRTPYREW